MSSSGSNKPAEAANISSNSSVDKADTPLSLGSKQQKGEIGPAPAGYGAVVNRGNGKPARRERRPRFRCRSQDAEYGIGQIIGLAVLYVIMFGCYVGVPLWARTTVDPSTVPDDMRHCSDAIDLFLVLVALVYAFVMVVLIIGLAAVVVDDRVMVVGEKPRWMRGALMVGGGLGFVAMAIALLALLALPVLGGIAVWGDNAVCRAEPVLAAWRTAVAFTVINIIAWGISLIELVVLVGWNAFCEK